MHPDDVNERLTALETQLTELRSRHDRLADEAAIVQLVAGYAPAVDSGRAETVAALWTDSGEYDVDTGALHGRAEIAAMVEGSDHQGLIAHGCAHLPGLPQVVLDGDQAVVTGHSLLVVRSSRPGRYTVMRATANRWELQRTGGTTTPHRGWQVVRRTARLLTDDGAGRALLARADG